MRKLNFAQRLTWPSEILYLILKGSASTLDALPSAHDGGSFVASLPIAQAGGSFVGPSGKLNDCKSDNVVVVAVDSGVAARRVVVRFVLGTAVALSVVGVSEVVRMMCSRVGLICRE